VNPSSDHTPSVDDSRFRTVQGRHSLDLRNAAPGQFGRSHNAHAGLTKPDDAKMVRKVGLAPSISPSPLSDLDPRALAFTTGLVVVAGRLKRYP
jgi:hypothetical protein